MGAALFLGNPPASNYRTPVPCQAILAAAPWRVRLRRKYRLLVKYKHTQGVFPGTRGWRKRSCNITSPIFFISAAEHSGDALGAALIAALRGEFPKARFTGIGGAKMAKAGCRVLADPTRHSAMLLGAVAQTGYWFELLARLKKELALDKPNVIIPIDSPTVNLRIARLGQRLRIPVCYYVAPQLWAWAPWRIKTLRASVNTLCCVLPFEQAYFGQQGVPTVYVGHPLFDLPADQPQTDPDLLRPPLPKAAVRIALLPGSRQAEITANFPPMLETFLALRGKFPGIAAVAAAADEDRAWQIRNFLPRYGAKIEVRTGATDAIIRWADLVLTCSGTATLQIARHHKPMLVLYRLAWWKWNLAGRFLVQSKFLCLVNILADRELVPEFMPFYGAVEPLVATATDLLAHPEKRQAVARQLAELTAPMAAWSDEMPAAQRVALEVARLMALH
ncbi:MAG: lipid-A-disaccharide synthase [Phycisphaerae bacterium]